MKTRSKLGDGLVYRLDVITVLALAAVLVVLFLNTNPLFLSINNIYNINCFYNIYIKCRCSRCR